MLGCLVLISIFFSHFKKCALGIILPGRRLLIFPGTSPPCPLTFGALPLTPAYGVWHLPRVPAPYSSLICKAWTLPRKKPWVSLIIAQQCVTAPPKLDAGLRGWTAGCSQGFLALLTSRRCRWKMEGVLWQAYMGSGWRIRELRAVQIHPSASPSESCCFRSEYP